jgi:ferredoxin
LDSEINFIANLGVRLFTNAKIDSLDELCRNYDAVIIATGARNQNDNHQFNLEHDEHGIKICHDTFATDLPKVFACGSAVKPVRFVARSMGQGKAAAAAVDRYLRGIAPHKQFFTNTGHLSDAEIESLAGSIPFARKNDPRINPPSENDIIDADTDIDINISIDDDPNRCLLCDCGKKNGCSLRDYSAQYGAHHLRYAADRRKPYIRKLYGGGLVHEPGKCISCGKCVGLTRERNVKPGLSFSGRGSDVCVSAPFGTPFDAAMGDALAECVAACPTGALWIRN